MKKYILLILINLCIASCIPDEDPVTPYDRGDLEISSVNMGQTYAEQIYFSLESNSVIKHNLLTDWDIAFSCQEDSHYLILNYAKFMRIAKLSDADFDTIDKTTVKEIPDEDWLRDHSNGNPDSSAFGTYWSKSGSSITLNPDIIYIVDRGTDDKAKKQGTVKLKILSLDASSCTLQFADVKENISHTITVNKNPLYNFIHINFDNEGSVIELEPPKDQWDIIFTKYTQLLYTDEGEAMWYSVSGAYLNPYNVTAALIDSVDFQSITSAHTPNLQFSSDRNAIGHTWKSYDMETGSYLVNPKKVYLIKSVSNFIYKLHFMDFYNDSGEKGSPKFEYQKL